MSIRAPKPIIPQWYTPEGEDGAQPARFKLRGLTTLEKLTLSDLKIQGARIYLTPENAKSLFGMCLLEWDQVLTCEGAPLKLDKDMQKNLEVLSTDLINELGAEMLRLSFLEEVEKKTSSSPLRSLEDHSTATDVPGGDTATTAIQPSSRSGKSKGS